MSILPEPDTDAGTGALRAFRAEFHQCLRARSDALFELADAVLCSPGPVVSLPGLSLTGVFTRGHGALYDALAAGRIDTDQLRNALAAQPIGRIRGRIVLAVDATGWLRPDANCAPGRLYCHVSGHGRGQDQMVPGWSYSFAAALESGASSWTQILDAVRIGPDDDPAETTALQLRAVVDRLIRAGQHRSGDPAITIVTDSGYDVPRLAWQLRDLPVIIVGRLRSDRVLYGSPGPWSGRGRPPKHGHAFRMADPDTWGEADTATSTETVRYGRLEALAWEDLHSRLTHRAAWIGHEGALPVIDGTLIRLKTERLPHTGEPRPLWLWTSHQDLDPGLLDTIWSAWLRRFDIEHTFRFLKQTLGWTVPQVRDPESADRWTWMIIAGFTQLGLARSLAADLRLPWETPVKPGRLTPARVRRDFPNLHAQLPRLARAPKHSKPGPGRPRGQRNRHRPPIEVREAFEHARS
ncbi:NF041680 family putative transposase [Glycomyces buryatensis]|uniref:Transposase n=1 Tax=Glycomyces buryatensis TaxID=2570927 RepID=A0A4S8QEC1_9ACTN|nr:NF041680 family putative transposase [Glycomyces buryatensis]THV42748.1 transposase [Glycomyces buryatensis]